MFALSIVVREVWESEKNDQMEKQYECRLEKAKESWKQSRSAQTADSEKLQLYLDNNRKEPKPQRDVRHPPTQYQILANCSLISADIGITV